MAVRDLILRLALKNWEKGKEFSKQIQTSIQKSVDLSKEARKELVEAVRERTKAAGILARRARKLAGRADALQEARADDPEGLGLLGQSRGVLQARKALGQIGGLASGDALGVAQDLLGDAAGKAGAAAIAALVIRQVKAYVDSEFAKLQNDRTQAFLVQFREEMRSFEERMRSEILFREEQASAAAAEYAAYEHAREQSGLSPAVEYLEGE